MKAVTVNRYGGPEVMVVGEVSRPKPKAGEILVRVKASTVTAGTVLVRRGKHPDKKIFTPLIRLMFGICRPRRSILGYEFSGIVEALGDGVTAYKVGDRVFGTTTGLNQGAYAEYICVPVSWKKGVVDKLPTSLPLEYGVALPIGAMTAYELLEKVSIDKGSNILVYGASGSVGTYVLQLAKYRGGKVTAVCSQGSFELVNRLGADEVMDYHAEDYRIIDKTYDIVIDAVGKMRKCDRQRFLKGRGCLVTVESPTEETKEALAYMLKLVVDGKMEIVIDKTYPLEEISSAHAYAEAGHKKGNVVVRI